MLARIVADEWTYTNTDGVVETRAQVFDDMKSGAYQATSFVSDDLKIQVLGDTALVNLRNTVVGRHQGRDVSGQTRATDVWIKRDGRWQCIASHESNLQPNPADTAAVEKERIQLEHAWAKAYIDRDAAALARLMADDFTSTAPDGGVTTKAQELEAVKTGASGATSITHENGTARIYGNTAVVNGRSTLKMQYLGQEVAGRVQWTDTWMKRDGRWLCVAGHFSRVAAPLADTAAVEQELIKLERAWADASVKGDVTALSELLADEAILGLSEGKWQTKAEFIDDYRSGRFDSTSESQDGVKARAYGDVAVVRRDSRWQCVASHGSKVPAVPTDTAAVEQKLMHLARDWAKAYVARDGAPLDRILAAEYARTDTHGHTATHVTKAEEIRDVASGAYATLSAEISEMRVRHMGDTAIVTGRWTDTAKREGATATRVFQFTDTFIRRDSRWQCVAGHASDVTPPLTIATAEQELIKIEHDWAKAFVARDLNVLDRVEADDYIAAPCEGGPGGAKLDNPVFSRN